MPDMDRYPLQNDFKILAHLSHSLSRVVGQNASEPILLVNLLMGVPSFSAHPQTLSKPALLPCLRLSRADPLGFGDGGAAYPPWTGA